MATLKDTIAADLASGDLDDLFETVDWGGTETKAMVESVPIEEQFDAMGGPILSSQRIFKFSRQTLLEIDADYADTTLGTKITYSGRSWDIDEVTERPEWPMVVVRAQMRN